MEVSWREWKVWSGLFCRQEVMFRYTHCSWFSKASVSHSPSSRARSAPISGPWVWPAVPRSKNLHEVLGLRQRLYRHIGNEATCCLTGYKCMTLFYDYESSGMDWKWEKRDIETPKDSCICLGYYTGKEGKESHIHILPGVRVEYLWYLSAIVALYSGA